MRRVLIVDDEVSMCTLWSRVLKIGGFAVSTAQTGEEALTLLRGDRFDVAVLDLHMVPMNGLQVLRAIRAENIDTSVIILSAYQTVEACRECATLGVYDFLQKPCSYDDLVATLEGALDYLWKCGEPLDLLSRLAMCFRELDLSCESAPMRQLCREIRQLAPTPFPVMITGEKGTEKEQVAKAIHSASPRQENPFFVLDCMNLKTGEVCRQLFGEEATGEEAQDAGSFGWLAAAEGGSVFVNNIQAISLEDQRMLIDRLEGTTLSGKSAPSTIVGGVRLISGADPDIQEEIERGEFLEELYNYLSSVYVQVAPLRDRREDVLPTVHWLFGQILGPDAEHPKVAPEVLGLLEDYAWPGNVEELTGVVRHGLANLHEGVFAAASLPDEFIRATGAWVVGSAAVGIQDPGYQRRIKAFLQDHGAA